MRRHVSGMDALGISQRDRTGDALGQTCADAFLSEILGHDVGTQRMPHQKERRPFFQSVRQLHHDASEVTRVPSIVPSWSCEHRAARSSHVEPGSYPTLFCARLHHAAHVPELGIVVDAVQDEDDGSADGTVSNLIHLLLVRESIRRSVSFEFPIDGHLSTVVYDGDDLLEHDVAVSMRRRQLQARPDARYHAARADEHRRSHGSR
mmetsp:Transcript_21805/g.62090  ORF Transcript_21805/g.62090 Transcript_21805/m.62090 type:complete len:206 (+) Transcript_21805:575-1192(+)